MLKAITRAGREKEILSGDFIDTHRQCAASNVNALSSLIKQLPSPYLVLVYDKDEVGRR